MMGVDRCNGGGGVLGSGSPDQETGVAQTMVGFDQDTVDKIKIVLRTAGVAPTLPEVEKYIQNIITTELYHPRRAIR